MQIILFVYTSDLTYTSIANSYYYTSGKIISEMKGDVGMSLHEKEGEQEDA